jgi:glycosyltransferase involved in cell wall biosynthesis
LKALFVHSLKFYESNTNELYLRGYDNSYWKRYLNHFDTIKVIGRKYNINNSELKGYSQFKNVNLKFIEVPEIHSHKSFIRNNLLLMKILKEEISHSDYVIARLPGVYSNRAIKICKKLKKPYIVELVGCPLDALTTHSLKGKIIAPFIAKITKRIVKNSPFVVYVTKEYLQDKYPTNGINTYCSNVTLPPNDISILDKRLLKINNSKAGNDLIFGTVGAIDVKYKGHEYVIRAISQLEKDIKQRIKYHIVGGGNKKYLSNIIKKYNLEDQVILLGSMNHDKVFEWLDTIDVYIQPSLTEGLPRALIEAMSRGLISFGSNVGGIPELIGDEFLFKSKSSSEIHNIFKKINQFSFEKEAKNNFYKSRDYEFEKINKRRDLIFKKFVEKYN